VRDRIASSAVIVLVVILPTLIGGLVFAALLLVLGLVAFREYVTLAQKIVVDSGPASGSMAAITVVLFAIAAYLSIDGPAFYTVVAASLVAPILPVLGTAPSSPRLNFATLTTTGALGIGLTIFAAITLRGIEGNVAAGWLDGLAQAFAIGGPSASRGLAWVLIVILVTWTNDTFAYLFGRAIGRHPLAPSISPRKTAEGSFAGLAGSSLIGAIGFATFGLGDWWIGGLAGCLIGVAGQIGDLAESYLKRVAGVKDSGSLIPGHGGMFDRIDGLVFAFPAGYVLAIALERLSR